MASFSIIINASPVSHQAHHSAFQFATAARKQGHDIKQLFFFQDGVNTGSALLSPAGDETNWAQRWASFAEQQIVTGSGAQTQLVLCVASALRRGVINKDEAAQIDSAQFNLHPAFRLGGLGELVTHSLDVDRVIHFK
ncbi:sulfurtransferase complex subunit TusD [Corallincola luteus]|uniref:Sulfurtransferase complex subunit TusD n=1 Tax=Corallincola luteus TaxID=1775177 RepID=A0ABY2AJ71_9GAMM|nr:sulfurtransferase complex subunit TusD [Corallincola luteus]TCI01361.1 sulfurtransferase complex subunit TusD [Corallincola luteus]